MSKKEKAKTPPAAKPKPKTAKPGVTSSSPVKSAESAAASAKTVKTPSPRKQSASGIAKPSAGAKPKDNAAKSVRPTTATSASQARQEAFQVASESLLSLTLANFAALRKQLHAGGGKRTHATTPAKDDDNLAEALKRLEMGYCALLRRS